MAAETLLDDEQAAELLTRRTNRPISRRTVQRWRLEGLIAYRRIGKTPRMRRADLEAFLERDLVPAKPVAS